MITCIIPLLIMLVLCTGKEVTETENDVTFEEFLREFDEVNMPSIVDTTLAYKYTYGGIPVIIISRPAKKILNEGHGDLFYIDERKPNYSGYCL